MTRTTKKKPERRCTGCGEHFEKDALLRVVRTPEGEILLDKSGRAAGRGAYLCPKAACLRRARKAKRLEQNLGCAISDEIYEALEGELNRE